MKISKLFHWLYALVMLLPIFAIGVTSLVSTFNMSAKQESEIHYKYETNEVNTIDDLIEGNAYHMSLNAPQMTFLDNCFMNIQVISIDKIYFNNGEPTDAYIDTWVFTENEGYYPSIDISISPQSDFDLYIYYPSLESGYCVEILSLIEETYFEMDFKLLHIDVINSQDFNNFIRNNTFTKCENIPIDYVETHNVEPQEVFYRAVDKVQQSSLFNWAYDSFLVAPFAYIVNLFSMPTNSFVVMILSYWLSISIIWLVFDLIMYIPLLVHRWLDKGVLE